MSDYDLKAVLKRIKKKPFNFALIKGSENDQVYISPKPATTKVLGPILDECGDGKRIAKGLCMWEKDQLVFATKAAPSGSWEKMITKIFKDNQCAKYLPVALRQLGESESDEVSVEEESAQDSEPAVQPGTIGSNETREEWLRIKAALTPRIKEIAGGNAPNKVQVLGLVQEALAFEKAGQIAAALEAIRRCEGLLVEGNQTQAAPKGSLSANELMAALNRLTPQIKAAVAANPSAKQTLLTPVAGFQAHIKAGRLEEAAIELKRVAALLAAPSGGGLEIALAEWANARAAAIGQLQLLEKAIRGMNDPEGNAAIILLKAIQANLTAQPATSQAVTELERYLTTDQIVEEAEGPNGFGLRVELRQPLLPVLTKLRAALAA